jgi:molybdopterin converting factor small subunit
MVYFLKKLLATLLFVNITIFALNVKAEESSIDAQIERIRGADPMERRELMNRFKEQLARMNRKERVEALRKLLGKMEVENEDKRANQLANSMNNRDIKRSTDSINHHMPRQPMGSGKMRSGHH